MKLCGYKSEFLCDSCSECSALCLVCRKSWTKMATAGSSPSQSQLCPSHQYIMRWCSCLTLITCYSFTPCPTSPCNLEVLCLHSEADNCLLSLVINFTTATYAFMPKALNKADQFNCSHLFTPPFKYQHLVLSIVTPRSCFHLKCLE